ncbi:MAG: 30S ribosomal protein S20 [Deltaproteobacteria bacterium]|nr:30S ribosomal protein S20 [Deltaproteobacteria bacterium]
MANHKSAEKRARQNEKRRIRNKAVKTRIKHVTKEVRQASGEASSKEEALAKLKAAQSVVDKALKKGVIHKKTAARKISRLSRLVNTIVIF